jgi:hypothetical protein
MLEMIQIVGLCLPQTPSVFKVCGELHVCGGAKGILASASDAISVSSGGAAFVVVVEPADLRHETTG